MNLLITKPDDFGEELVFCLPYNLNRKSKKINGKMAVTKSELVFFEDEKEIKRYSLDYFDEYVCEQLIGCSMMVGKKDNEYTCLCAFTQDSFLYYAEICKILEFYKRTGELMTETDDEEIRCKKCHMPLDGSVECPFCAKKSKVFLKLISRVAPYKWYFVGAIICTILTQAIWFCMPYFNRVMIDDFITPKRQDWDAFLTLSAVMIIFTVLTGVFDFINMKCSFKVALSLGRDLRQAVFDKTQSLSMSSISKKTAGELISRISNDSMKLQDFITANGKDAVVQVLSLIILSVLIFVLNWRLALLVVLPVPLVMYLVCKLFNTMSVRYGKVWRLKVRHSSLLHDILNGVRVVKSYGTEKREIEKYKTASYVWAKSQRSAEIVWYLTIPFSDFILMIGNFLVLYFGGKMILGETLQLGELVQFTSYVSMLYNPIRWMINIPRTLADASVSASRVFEILDETTNVNDKEESIDLDIKGEIKFDDVYFGYKVYNPVLKGINCTINQGEMVGIVGHSGVGKSTMINLILRLYDCTQGRILIDGVNIKDLSQNALRSQIGVVLQETFLFEGSVLENIMYSKPGATFEEVIRAAKIANAHDFIVRLPDGYNTRVGNKGYTLSGGERQRIAIARAILHDPKIIILDEATASLDTQTEKQIQEALARLTKGRTTIAIAHRLSTLSNADRLIVLDKGKLAEMGTHDQLMRNSGVYYKLVMAQRQTTKMKKVKPQILTES